MSYKLTPREQELLRGKGADARLFKEGAECEARMRKEEVPPQLRDLVDTIQILATSHSDWSPEEVISYVSYIYTGRRLARQASWSYLKRIIKGH